MNNSLVCRTFVYAHALGMLMSPGFAGAASDCVLAQRYRPYIKMSQGRGGDEPYHPADWKWVTKNSTLTQGGKTWVAPPNWSSDFHELLENGGDLRTNAADSGLKLNVPSSVRGGEPWADVIHQGHGTYAHVEHLSPTQTSIEYYFSFAYNEPPGVPSQAHDGDLAIMVVVVDQGAEVISRVVYGAHGCMMQVAQTQGGQPAAYAAVAGMDEFLHPTETQVAQVNAQTAYDSKMPCTFGLTATSNSHFYLAADPYSHVYQHPAVYLEVGDHELWPNASGYLSFEGGHDGSGVSFVPASVQVLGNVDNPAPGQEPFVRYNGKFGTDPAAVALHKTWCWVASAANKGTGPPCQVPTPYAIPDNRFADMDPYRKIGSQVWPPPPYVTGDPDLYVVPDAPGSSGTGASQMPIADFKLAYSVAAAGRTLHLQTGQYGGNVILAKPMNIVADGGPVTIGGAIGSSVAGTSKSAEQICGEMP